MPLVAMATLVGCGPTVALDDASGDGTASVGRTSTAGSTTVAADTTAGPSTTTGPAVPPLPDHCGDAVLQDHWVHIDGGVLDERDALEGVAVIEGDLVIAGAPDADLSFLECIVEITGDLRLYDNDQLVDVSGLAHVARIGGDVYLIDNDALPAFDALHLVQEIEQDESEPFLPMPRGLFVIGNDALTSLSGLSALTAIHGGLWIRDNPNLSDISGLLGLTEVGEALAINHNASLCVSSIEAVAATITVGDPGSWSAYGNDEGC